MELQVFMIFFFNFIFGEQLVTKVKEDLSVHNREFIELLAIVLHGDVSQCTYLCEKYTQGVSNLRVLNSFKQRCECYFAIPEDFADSRSKAPRMKEQTFLANC